MNGYAKLWWFNGEGPFINILLMSNYLSGYGLFEFARRFMAFDLRRNRFLSFIFGIRYVFLILFLLSLVLPYSLMVKGVILWGFLLPFLFLGLGVKGYQLKKIALYLHSLGLSWPPELSPQHWSLLM